MIIAALILIYVIIIYLAFTVNVFQFGLLLFDNADGDSFSDLDDSRRRKLNVFFEDLTSFNHFVTLYDNFAAITTAAIALYFAGKLSNGTPILYAAWAVLALIVTLLVNLVVAQTMSKRVPSRWIEKTLKSRLSMIRFLYMLFRPFVRALGILMEKFKREHLSEEQKEDMVERAIESLADSAGLNEPLVEEDEKEMIGNIFELDQTAVKEIMVPRTEMTGISIFADFDEIQRIAIASGHSRFPVFTEDLDNIKGILYVKDLFANFPLPIDNFSVSDFMRKPYFVPETKKISDLLNELKLSHKHIAIVVDEYGGIAGLITLEDVIEVIVGDIQDEHDTEEADIVKLDNGSIRVDANISIEDIADHLGVEIDDGEFETVGGLIYDLVGSLPRVGQIVSSEHFEFTVERMEGQRIETVRVQLRQKNSH